MEDRSIIRLFFARSDRALEALADRFGQRLHQTAQNILGNSQDAEEAVNDTYLALWDTIPPEEPDPLGAYVYRVGRNIALKKLRFQSAQKRSSAFDLSLEELSGVLPDNCLEEALDARALGQCINAFLGTLSEQNRRIFLRRYWFGDSLEALAKDQGSNVNAITVRLSRIRKQLKEYLNKEGFFL